MTTTQKLQKLAADTVTEFPRPSSCGQVWQFRARIIGGEKVEAHRLDWGRKAWFEVPNITGTQQLTEDEATALLS